MFVHGSNAVGAIKIKMLGGVVRKWKGYTEEWTVQRVVTRCWRSRCDLAVRLPGRGGQVTVLISDFRRGRGSSLASSYIPNPLTFSVVQQGSSMYAGQTHVVSFS